jgi:hypothetical protein
MDGVAEKAIHDVASMSTDHKITQIFIRNLRLNGKSFKVEKKKYKVWIARTAKFACDGDQKWKK